MVNYLFPLLYLLYATYNLEEYYYVYKILIIDTLDSRNVLVNWGQKPAKPSDHYVNRNDCQK